MPSYVRNLAEIFAKLDVEMGAVKYYDKEKEKEKAKKHFSDWMVALLPLGPDEYLENERLDTNYQQEYWTRKVLNKDQNPNVLLRSESIQLIMNNLYKEVQRSRNEIAGRLERVLQAVQNPSLKSLIEPYREDVEYLTSQSEANIIAVFREAGSSVGRSFAKGFLKSPSIDALETFRRRVDYWCQYDSKDAGFGKLRAFEDKEGLVNNLEWDTCFLLDEYDCISSNALFFLEGYIEEILISIYNNMDSGGPEAKIDVTSKHIISPGGAIKVEDKKLKFDIKYKT
jgi:hypothetical protein